MTTRTTSEAIKGGGAAPGRALRAFAVAAALGCAAAPVSGCLWWDGPSRSEVRAAAKAELEKQAALTGAWQALFSGKEPAYRVDVESFEILFKEKDANAKGQYNFRVRMAFLVSAGPEEETVRSDSLLRIAMRKNYGEWETVAFEEEEEAPQ